jgi:collagenase-like PrtC family protease
MVVCLERHGGAVVALISGVALLAAILFNRASRQHGCKQANRYPFHGYPRQQSARF